MCTGAVMARLRVYDSGVSFVSSHLSSGEQEGDDQKRNADYHDIVRRAVFPNDAESLEPDSLSQVHTLNDPSHKIHVWQEPLHNTSSRLSPPIMLM